MDNRANEFELCVTTAEDAAEIKELPMAALVLVGGGVGEIAVG